MSGLQDSGSTAAAMHQLMSAVAVGRRSLDTATAALKRLENPAIASARYVPRTLKTLAQTARETCHCQCTARVPDCPLPPLPVISPAFVGPALAPGPPPLSLPSSLFTVGPTLCWSHPPRHGAGAGLAALPSPLYAYPGLIIAHHCIGLHPYPLSVVEPAVFQLGAATLAAGYHSPACCDVLCPSPPVAC